MCIMATMIQELSDMVGGGDGHARLPQCRNRSHGPRVSRHAELFLHWVREVKI